MVQHTAILTMAD